MTAPSTAEDPSETIGSAAPGDIRAAADPVLVFDPGTGRPVYVARGRANRPVTATAGCPFCPGGRDAADGAAAWAIPNRWPPIARGRCEVLIHSPRHDLDFATMGPADAERVIDLWADRSLRMAAQPDVRTVLVFENRLATAGATVEHPHSQLFGLPFVPPMLRPAARHTAAACTDCLPAEPRRTVAEAGGWRLAVPEAPPAPYALRITPAGHVPNLAALDPASRAALAAALTDAVRRLDALFGEPMPYQLWVNQSFADGAETEPAAPVHLAVMLCGLLVRPGRLRILGAAELATGVLFTPTAPDEAADALRAIDSTAEHG